MSHGWYDLPPFEFDEKYLDTHRVIDLDSGRPVTVTITRTEGSAQESSFLLDPWISAPVHPGHSRCAPHVEAR